MRFSDGAGATGTKLASILVTFLGMVVGKAKMDATSQTPLKPGEAKDILLFQGQVNDRGHNCL